MKKTLIFTSLLFLNSLLIADQHARSEEKMDKIIQKGDEVSSDLVKTLGKNLKARMKSEGPIGAARFCNLKAYDLTQKVGSKYGKGVSVKRISLKYRSPANKPEGSEKDILLALQALQDNGVFLPKQVVQELDQDRVKFYKPLIISKAVCLKCHGNISKSEVGSFMKEHYPEDRALGYKMGDLRGAVVVTIEK